MRLPMYQPARNSPKHSSEASQFSVTRQITTRQVPADARNSSRHLATAGHALMIDENVGEAIGAQPGLQRASPRRRPCWNGLRTAPPWAAHPARCDGTNLNRLRLRRDLTLTERSRKETIQSVGGRGLSRG